MQIALDLADARDNIIFSPEEELWQGQIVSRSCDYMLQTIEDFRSLVSEDLVTAASKLLNSASEVTFFTQVTSSFFRQLQRCLLLDGKNVNIVNDTDDYKSFIQTPHQSQVAFFLSFEGLPGIDITHAIQTVRMTGAKIIWVSLRDFPCTHEKTDLYINVPYSGFRRDIFGYELLLSCITIAYDNLSI